MIRRWVEATHVRSTTYDYDYNVRTASRQCSSKGESGHPLSP